MGNQRKTRQQRNMMIMRLVLAVIMVACIAVVVIYFVRGKKADEAYDNLENVAKVEDVDQTVEDSTEESHVEYEGMPVIDFETLQDVNPDIKAWITIPNTQIDYPVMQNTSATEEHDTYYLDHTVEGASGLPGAIYIEPINADDFTDSNTVIYGHNMKNGTMFGDLHKFEDDTFFEENQYVYIVTPEKSLVYQVFAVIIYDDRHITGSYGVNDVDAYQAFLDSLEENRNMGDMFREGVEVTTEDRIITMSTCIKDKSENRLLVEAVLVDEYEN